MHLPELLAMFESAPVFIARKPQKAVLLSEGGELMVESNLAECMAAGIAPLTHKAEKGEFVVFEASQADKVAALLDKNGCVTPSDLLDSHIEIMDVLSEEELTSNSILTGKLGSLDTQIFIDPLLAAIVAPEDIIIQAFANSSGIEKIRAGQIIVKNAILGVFPYERPHKSLTSDSTFLNYHLPVIDGKISTIEASAPHKAFIKALLDMETATKVG